MFENIFSCSEGKRFPFSGPQEGLKIWGRGAIIEWYTVGQVLHLFPVYHAFWFLEKTMLRKNFVSRTVLMIELMQNSPHLRVNRPKPALETGLVETTLF